MLTFSNSQNRILQFIFNENYHFINPGSVCLGNYISERTKWLPNYKPHQVNNSENKITERMS